MQSGRLPCPLSRSAVLILHLAFIPSGNLSDIEAISNRFGSLMPPCSCFPLPPEKCRYLAYAVRIVDRLHGQWFSPLLQLGWMRWWYVGEQLRHAIA